jgi:hypothetical protein
MDSIIDSVSRKASLHDAFSWCREIVGVLSLWTRLSDSRIFNSALRTVHSGGAGTRPQDFTGGTKPADQSSRHKPIQDSKERGLKTGSPRPFVGWAVTAKGTTWRREWFKTTNTYRTLKRMVGTVKKSIAQETCR